MEKLFLFVADSQDSVFLEELPEETFWQQCQLTSDKLPLLIQDSRFQTEAELVSWGNFYRLEKGELQPDPALINSSRILNNKVNQASWRLDTNCSPIQPKIIGSLESLQDCLEEQKFPIVIKSQYGLAGRNHIILENPKDQWKLQDIERKLHGFPFVLEPWKKNRVLDFSTLWSAEENSLKLLGYTSMLVDEKGGFRGICISKDKNPILENYLPSIYDSMQKISKEWPVPASGALAMDGFFYREKESSDLFMQPFSEINFRWSIGRVLWEIRKKRRAEGMNTGILFLSFGKLKDFDPFSFMEIIRKEWKGVSFYITPPKDQKGKLFQQAGIYFESPEENAFDALVSLCNNLE